MSVLSSEDGGEPAGAQQADPDHPEDQPWGGAAGGGHGEKTAETDEEVSAELRAG